MKRNILKCTSQLEFIINFQIKNLPFREGGKFQSSRGEEAFTLGRFSSNEILFPLLKQKNLYVLTLMKGHYLQTLLTTGWVCQLFSFDSPLDEISLPTHETRAKFYLDWSSRCPKQYANDSKKSFCVFFLLVEQQTPFVYQINGFSQWKRTTTSKLFFVDSFWLNKAVVRWKVFSSAFPLLAREPRW